MPFARIVFYAATLAAFGVPVAAYFGQGPSAAATSGAVFGYIALVSCGVVFSGWGMFADVVTCGPRDAVGVALTFDDGPDPETTLPLLDWLDESDIRATFFVIGHKAEVFPDVVREIHRRGHEIGVHSYAHSRSMSFYPPGWVRRDLERAVKVIEGIIEVRPRLFRPPIGHISPAMARVLKDLDLMAIGWSSRGFDGLARTQPDAVARRISGRLCDGAIVLMHDASERGDFTPVCLQALPEIRDAAKRRNLSFVSLATWLDAPNPAAEG